MCDNFREIEFEVVISWHSWHQSMWQLYGGGSKGGGGGQQTPPPKFGSTMFLFNPILYQKAQIARESNKTTLEFPGPLSEPWTPVESEFGSALVMCVRAHNLLRPPPPNENPGSAPVLHGSSGF